MTASPPQSPPPPAPPVKGLECQLRLHRLWALLFLMVGGLLLAANLNLLPPAAQRGVGWVWPGLVIVTGLWVLLTGRSRADSARPTFALDRADYTSGALVVNTGSADLQIGALAAADHLALGQLPTPHGPVLTTAGRAVRLRMTPRLAVPLLAGRPWSIDLAPDLPWALQWQSSLGDMALDLHGLNLTTAYLRSAVGQVDLTLPAGGQADLQVRLGLGNLTVRVPETMAVKVKFNRGRLATVRPDGRRFVELAPGEWATPLFAVSPVRCTVTVYLWAGDLTLV